MKPEDLTAREGKVLRYVVSHNAPVAIAKCIVKIEWSDLPHTWLQSKHTLEKLRAYGLVKQQKGSYLSTPSGEKLISRANKQGSWRT